MEPTQQTASALPGGPKPPSRAQLRLWRSLRRRQARLSEGLFLAEGEHLTQEALRAGAARALLFARGREARLPGGQDPELPRYLLSEKDFAGICDTRTPQGVAALCALPAPIPASALGERVVALNALQDPGNVGTILRTMDAAGFTGLLIDAETADPFGPKALRASMGAVFRVPVAVTENLAPALEQLRGYEILAGDLRGEPFFSRPRSAGPLCLLIGSEGAGLSRELLALATRRVSLPMPGGAESLNAAVAASVMIYDHVRLSAGAAERNDREDLA